VRGDAQRFIASMGRVCALPLPGIRTRETGLRQSCSASNFGPPTPIIERSPVDQCSSPRHDETTVHCLKEQHRAILIYTIEDSSNHIPGRNPMMHKSRHLILRNSQKGEPIHPLTRPQVIRSLFPFTRLPPSRVHSNHSRLAGSGG
jgi:hypothetical protein